MFGSKSTGGRENSPQGEDTLMTSSPAISDAVDSSLYRKDTDATQAVACVMVSFHTGDVLFEAIDSVLHQSFGVTELVVVDNGNPPEVQQRLDGVAEVTPQLSVIRGQGNVGFAAGSNLGAASCRSGHLFFLNPDCVLPIDGLARLWAEYGTLPPRSLLSPLLLNPDYTEQRGSRRSVLTPWRAVVEWLGLYHLAPSHPYFLRFNRSNDPLPINTHRVDVTSGAAMFMARSLFEELRGFDEGYFLHVEDIDLCVSLLKRGGATYVAPGVRVIHQGGSSRSLILRVEWHKARGFCRYFRKHFSGVYPPGFVSIVNGLVWLRLGLRAPLLLVSQYTAGSSRSAVTPPRSVTPPDTGD